MITPTIATLCGMVLVIAALLEIANPKQARFVGMLAAFGFMMLGIRFFYIIHADELARLNIFGTASVGAIALARIMDCAAELRK